MSLRRIVSGGQTGADRGGLDAAIELGLEHGGYCPRGRRAEDGQIPARYHMTALSSADYPARTEANIADADATLIVARGQLRGGTKLTATLARREGVPLLVVDLDRDLNPTAELISWLDREAIEVLNVAGPRASGCPGIARDVREFLVRALRG